MHKKYNSKTRVLVLLATISIALFPIFISSTVDVNPDDYAIAVTIGDKKEFIISELEILTLHHIIVNYNQTPIAVEGEPQNYTIKQGDHINYEITDINKTHIEMVQDYISYVDSKENHTFADPIYQKYSTIDLNIVIMTSNQTLIAETLPQMNLYKSILSETSLEIENRSQVGEISLSEYNKYDLTTGWLEERFIEGTNVTTDQIQFRYRMETYEPYVPPPGYFSAPVPASSFTIGVKTGDYKLLNFVRVPLTSNYYQPGTKIKLAVLEITPDKIRLNQVIIYPNGTQGESYQFDVARSQLYIASLIMTTNLTLILEMMEGSNWNITTTKGILVLQQRANIDPSSYNQADIQNTEYRYDLTTGWLIYYYINQTRENGQILVDEMLLEAEDGVSTTTTSEVSSSATTTSEPTDTIPTINVTSASGMISIVSFILIASYIVIKRRKRS